MPVKIIIRENGKQCMMQMPVKTTLRLYCDDSRLVFKCMQIHQFIATQLPCNYSFVIKMSLKNHVKYVWKQEVPLPQQRLLLCIHVRGGHQRPTQAYRPQIFYYLLSYLYNQRMNAKYTLYRNAWGQSHLRHAVPRCTTRVRTRHITETAWLYNVCCNAMQAKAM